MYIIEEGYFERKNAKIQFHPVFLIWTKHIFFREYLYQHLLQVI